MLRTSLFLAAVLTVAACPAGASTLPEGSRAAGVEVDGRTPHQARALLRRKLAPVLSRKLVLTDGAKAVRATRRELGVTLDVARMVARLKRGDRVAPLMLAVDRLAAQKRLRAMAPRFRRAPRNARVYEYRGAVYTAKDRPGARLNPAASAAALEAQVESKPRSMKVRLRSTPVAASLRDEHLKGINGRLGRYTTRFSTGQRKRSHNIRLSVGMIHGTVVPPGGTYSQNRTVGMRTQKRGFRTAPVFDKGLIVPGIGGGVSQVTGTLFNAVLLSGLPIVEYGTHGRPVAYIPIGRDATLGWHNPDMRFRNTTGAPIYISYVVRGGTLTATLYGKKVPGQRVSLSVRSQKRGPRHITAQLYRTIRRSGKVVKKERVGRSEYRWKPDTG